MVVMHDLVIFLLVLKNGGPNISIVNAINTASPVITNTVSPTNTNTIGASPIKGEPTMQNAASPTFKQMLEVGLARLHHIPVDVRYKARRAADERMILEHMADQGFIHHETPEFISRGITSGPGYERLYQGTMFESALERYKAALERQKAASGRSSTWDRM